MPLTRARLRREDGWVLPAALGLLVAMISLGLALLTVVDAQTKESGQQPKRDAALNLAETALSGSSFALSRSWPTARDPNVPWTNQTTCASQSLSGAGSGTAASGTTPFAANVQQVVAQTWSSRPDAASARWSLHVCDDTGAGNARSTVWSDAGLGNAAFDANGAEQVAATGTQPAYTRRRMWVRAQATVAGKSRAVAGLVQVVEQPALPPGYAAVVGKIAYTSSSSPSAINDLLTSSASGAGTFTQSLVGNGSSSGIVRGGYIGQRCGLLDGCASAATATLTDVPLVENLGLLSSQVKQFGGPTAMSQDALDRLRQQAIQSGRYVAAASAGDCFAGLSAPSAGTVTFIEKVGTGTGQCTIQAPGTVGTVVVVSGRIAVQGRSGSTLNGVLYAANQQDDSAVPVIQLPRGVTVNGGVFVDGRGKLGIETPAFSTSSIITGLCNGGLVGYLTCLALRPLTTVLAADDLVDALLNGGCVRGVVLPVCLPRLGAGSVVALALPDLADDPPVVTLDTTQTNRVVTYGTAGTVQQSFREVPPRAGG